MFVITCQISVWTEGSARVPAVMVLGILYLMWDYTTARNSAQKKQHHTSRVRCGARSPIAISRSMKSFSSININLLLQWRKKIQINHNNPLKHFSIPLFLMEKIQISCCPKQQILVNGSHTQIKIVFFSKPNVVQCDIFHLCTRSEFKMLCLPCSDSLHSSDTTYQNTFK